MTPVRQALRARLLIRVIRVDDQQAERIVERRRRFIERDAMLAYVLDGLGDVPLEQVGHTTSRGGSQRRLGAAAGARTPEPSARACAEDAAPSVMTADTARELEPAPEARPSPAEDGATPGTGHVATGRRPRRPTRYGLGIQFEARPDDPELAQLVESTVWINESHPAYRRTRLHHDVPGTVG